MATVHGAEETMSSKKTKISGLMECLLQGWISREAGISYISVISRSQHGDKKTSQETHNTSAEQQWRVNTRRQ